MNMKQLFQRLSLKQKIVASFISIAMVAVLSMNYISHFYYSRSTQQDFYNIAETTTVSLNHQLEIYIGQIARSTYAMNAGVLQLFKRTAAGEFELDSGLAQGRFGDESGELLHDQRNAQQVYCV